MTTANYLASAVCLVDICETELLFGTLPIVKSQHQYIKCVWMKNSVVEERVIGRYNYIEHRVNDKRHRTDGKPAIVHADGSKYWFVNNKCHRVGGPATVYTDDDKFWYANGKLHRIGGPAIIYSNDKDWYINGRCHRTDGPARMYADGDKFWCIYGQNVDKF